MADEREEFEVDDDTGHRLRRLADSNSQFALVRLGGLEARHEALDRRVVGLTEEVQSVRSTQQVHESLLREAKEQREKGLTWQTETGIYLRQMRATLRWISWIMGSTLGGILLLLAKRFLHL